MSKPLFVLVAGPNGSGKSTFSKTLERHYPGISIVDPDAIAKEITGSFETIESEGGRAGRIAIKHVRDSIEAGVSFVVESTISGRLYLKYAKQARQAGFRTLLVYMGLETPELSAKRVALRVEKGGHKIPSADIIRRHPKSLANLPEHIRAFDIAHIYDNSNDRVWCLGYREGLLVKRARVVPGWISLKLGIE